MLRLVGQRMTHAVVLVLAVIVLDFFLLRLAPGDPVQTIAGMSGGMSEQLRAELVAQYGLDKPLLTQLAIYLREILSGNLGYSYFYNLPVGSLILERVPATLLLVLSALAFAAVVGTALGVLASRNPNGIVSQAITVLSIVGYSAPIFWTGILIIILFASIIPAFPISGMQDITADRTAFGTVLDVLHHLFLPALTLGIVYLAQYCRLARASMLDVLGSDYVRTARAKGLAEWKVFFKHGLRNAVLPVVTAIGMQFANILSGAILTETVFDWPGLGRLAFDSILRRDYPTILGLLLFSAILVVVVNQIVDFVYRVIDPRIRAQ
jgi:peptide/nickel transport system permease protein